MSHVLIREGGNYENECVDVMPKPPSFYRQEKKERGENRRWHTTTTVRSYVGKRRTLNRKKGKIKIICDDNTREISSAMFTNHK